MSYKDRKRYFEKYPWVKAMYGIRTRCCCGGKYFQKGIMNYLKNSDLKMFWFRDKAYLLAEPSIDRIDSALSYTVTNCRFIEKRINNSNKRTNKINFQIAEKIRKEYVWRKITQKYLANKYGVTSTFVNDILHNKWYRKGDS